MWKSSKFWGGSLLIIALFLGIGYVAAKFPDLDLRRAPENPSVTMLAICFGTFVSEDLTTITSGLLAASGILSYGQAVFAAFSGILIGDLIIFWMGYHFGRPFLSHRWTRFLVSEKAVNRAQHHFHRNGFWIIIFTRFLPGTRSATYFAAGAVHAPVITFIGAFALAAAIWTPFLVGLSYYIGRELLDLYEMYEALVLPALVSVGLALYFLFHYGLPLLSWKGRRRLKGKFIRGVKWEYWPAWQVYWLVGLYVMWIGVFRYRNPMLFTAVNPCMPDGGVIGESKSAILEGLSGAGDALPEWAMIGTGPDEERLQAFDVAMDARQLSYPVVLKPDEGQRGASVKVVRGREEAVGWFSKNQIPAILQEFVPGKEYGVFYMRKPSEKRGQITSITLKEQLQVEGNGSDDLETLIHAHPRAIAMLGTFLERFDSQLEEVPEKGEIVPLGELGTHSRGSLFLDGNHLITDALMEKFQDITGSYQGFYFGRFDVKAPSDETLMKGEGIQIIELNGVTSEETHIYDPQHGLLYAWKHLCRQWGRAFEIAAENVKAGYQPTSVKQFLRNLIAARRRQRQLD